jgi:hypothetical protein
MCAKDLHEVRGGTSSLLADHGAKYGIVGGVVGEAGADFVAKGIACREWECGGGAGGC